ncbi:hypothetical protein H4R99_005044 [Coemansia sp. RSA 1722]|nr:hypothetical protein LPJ57_003494 [Coemansia sp. RSA 486]KAJ2596144.1 hypothetical protein H4R99_005044 [Coemansia sp. RSA 1722]
MRYNSPVTQLVLVAITIILATGMRRLLENYLMQWTPDNENLGYNRYLPAGITACFSGFIGIFLVNLIGFRYIFVFYTITNIIYASSMFVIYQHGTSNFHTGAMILTIIGYYPSRVATLVIVLAYPGEKWKARALAAFLIIEYLATTIGDTITFKSLGHSNASQRYGFALAYLCVSCFVPFIALGIAPSHQIVRNNGVYLLSPETNFKTEVRELAKLFISRHMLLLLPYMYSYPMLFALANMQLPDATLLLMFDIGKLFILFTGQLLDVRWASRRVRGIVTCSLMIVFFAISLGTTTAVRIYKYDLSGIDVTWSQDKINSFVVQAVITQQHAMLMAVLFFAGIVTGMVEMFGYWVMGTLTNDLKSSARFVGTYHSMMAIGGLVGFRVGKGVGVFHLVTAGYYTATSLTVISFALIFFVVRRIPETNNWSLGSIAAGHNLSDSTSDKSAEIIATVVDVKHHHTHPSQV